MSLPEVLLWQRLKGSPQGIAFRKQHPIGGYRVDFYCPAAKLVIEVDGAAHDMGDRPKRDTERTKLLEAKGYQVTRISAADVLRDADAAAQSIVSFVACPLHHAFGAVPLPVNGEDFS
jgi:very-short-patch-repair endonuclease